MAIIKIGPPLSGIRGTIGGIVYSENKSGPYAKIWAQGSNPRTPRQSQERSFTSLMPSLWAGLTDTQRADWRTFAADPAQELTNPLGEAYYASGFNWFSKCNIRLLRVGLATISAIPTQARPASPRMDDFRVCVAGSETDRCTGGTPSASTDFGPGFVAAMAFDDNLVTLWATAWGQTTGWLEYILTGAMNIKHYAWYSGPEVATRPNTWAFQVWSGGGWQTIHVVTGFTPAINTWYHWYCANEYTETTYRILITANNGDPNMLGLNEFAMFLGDVGASVLCYPQDEFDAAPDYDLILHVSMGRSIGMAVQYPGFREILALPNPGQWYELCQDQIQDRFGTVLENRPWFARLYRQTTEGLRSAPETWRTVTSS